MSVNCPIPPGLSQHWRGLPPPARPPRSPEPSVTGGALLGGSSGSVPSRKPMPTGDGGSRGRIPIPARTEPHRPRRTRLEVVTGQLRVEPVGGTIGLVRHVEPLERGPYIGDVLTKLPGRSSQLVQPCVSVGRRRGRCAGVVGVHGGPATPPEDRDRCSTRWHRPTRFRRDPIRSIVARHGASWRCPQHRRSRRRQPMKPSRCSPAAIASRITNGRTRRSSAGTAGTWLKGETLIIHCGRSNS